MKAFIIANKKIIIKICSIGTGIVIFLLFLRYLFPYISPFFFGWLLSVLFNPFVTFLNKRFKISRSIGSVLAILILLTFFSSVVAGMIYRLINEAKLFYTRLPYYLETFQLAFETIRLRFNEWIMLLPDGLQPFFQNTNGEFLNIMKSFLTSQGSASSLHFVFAIPNMFMVSIVSILASFFFTKDRESIYTFVASHTPPQIKNSYLKIRQNIGVAIWGYIKSQLILMVVTFLVCSIGFFILNSPYSLLLSVIISIIDALPFFGSGFILWPLSLINLISGQTYYAAGYLIIYLVAMLLKQILQPKILGTQIGLPPLVTLVSMYIGLKTMGVFGMILGPLLAVLLKAGLEIRSHTTPNNPS